MSAAPAIYELLISASLARKDCDFKQLNQIADALERLEIFDKAWQFLAEVGLSRKRHELAEWRGEQLGSKRLLVERRIRHIGSELRMARFLNIASRFGIEVVSSVDKRLMPLFKRTFADITVIDQEKEPVSILSNTKSCSYETLALHYGFDKDLIRSSFFPLVPHPEITSCYRKLYSNINQYIVGIAWNSLNLRKELPGLSDWAAFVSAVDASFVSLQYNEEEFGLDELALLSGKHITSSNDVNQFLDLDGFAAQVAATDLVITISNTTAHMAGALGIPCLVILDDQFHLSWPYGKPETPFYPRTRLIRRNGRSWKDVFASLSEFLNSRTNPSESIFSLS